jgi:hypothetical protein
MVGAPNNTRKEMKVISKGLIGLASLSVLGGCGGSGTVFNTASLRNIEPLQNGFLYEGWGMVNGSPVSFGKFNVNAEGQVVSPSGAPMPVFKLPESLKTASSLIITIEPAVDPNPGPSESKFIGGPVVGGQATLTTASTAAIGTDFSSASGNFLFATPTEQPSNTNPLSGMWFMNGPGLAGLSLPTLPAGWEYEGWVVVGGRPLSTGKFSSPSGADSDSTFSGPNAGPPFPGEDFLRNAPTGLSFPTDLRSGRIVVSVEPKPDDSPAPFSLKPLVRADLVSVPSRTPTALTNQSASNAPSMTIQVN